MAHPLPSIPFIIYHSHSP